PVSQTWRQAGQAVGQPVLSLQVLPGNAQLLVQAFFRAQVATRSASDPLCEPEVTGPIPVRSTRLRPRSDNEGDVRLWSRCGNGSGDASALLHDRGLLYSLREDTTLSRFDGARAGAPSQM